MRYLSSPSPAAAAKQHHNLDSGTDADIALLIVQPCFLHTQTDTKMPITLTRYGMQPSCFSCRAPVPGRIVRQEVAALQAVAG